MKNLILLVLIGMTIISCSRKNSPVEESAPSSVVIGTARVLRPATGSPAAAMPAATAFRMSGDYADNVAIGVDASGQLTYFPAPGDLSENSRPLGLGDGWWLNRQGIGANAVFTKYTFAEYMKLPAAPSPDELKDAIIPGAKVVRMEKLPYTVNEASSHINEIKEYLKKSAPSITIKGGE